MTWISVILVRPTLMFVRWFREGRLPLNQLVTRRYTLDQINDACTALAHGEIEGRAIVVF